MTMSTKVAVALAGAIAAIVPALPAAAQPGPLPTGDYKIRMRHVLTPATNAHPNPQKGCVGLSPHEEEKGELETDHKCDSAPVWHLDGSAGQIQLGSDRGQCMGSAAKGKPRESVVQPQAMLQPCSPDLPTWTWNPDSHRLILSGGAAKIGKWWMCHIGSNRFLYVFRAGSDRGSCDYVPGLEWELVPAA